MRTTLNLNEELYEKARQATGVDEKTKLIHMGLEALIRNEAYKSLAKLKGSVKNFKTPKRRRVNL